jgi:arylsulfatase A-like enzyme
MNVVLIVCDTLRRDYLGCYGNDWVATPNLDAFALQAIVMDKCFVGSFPTIPMRADLMSGQYVFQTTGWAPLPAGRRTIQRGMGASGHVTQLIADHTQMLAPGMNFHQDFDGVEWIRGQVADKWATEPLPRDWTPPCDVAKMRHAKMWLRKYYQNIQHRRFEREYNSPRTMQAAIDWLEVNRAQPFYLLLDTFDVHEPWVPPPWYVDMYDPGYKGEQVIYPRYDRAGFLTDAELNHVRALYAGTITMLDKWFGRLVETIHDLGLWDSTAVLFTSDHGWYHGEHDYIGKHTVLEPKQGWPFYEEVAHAPLVMHIPGLQESTRSDLLCQPVDLMPTVLALGGADVPDGLDGCNLLPALRGQADPPRSIAVTSPRLSEDADPLVWSTATDGRWTLVYGGANAPSQLYDIDADPDQQHNVIADHPGLARDLHARHVELLKQIGTPPERLELRTALP